MTLAASNARSRGLDLDFEDLPGIQPSKPAVKKAIKKQRELNINQMSSGQIVWHLTVRHKFSLVSLYAVAITVVLIIKW